MAEIPKFKNFQEFKTWFDKNKDQFKTAEDFAKLAESIPEMTAAEARQWQEDVQKAFPAIKPPKNGDDKDNALDGTTKDDLMHGNGGNDHLRGKDGDDVLYGDGPDTGPDITKEFNVAIKKNGAGEIVYRHNGKEIFQDRNFDARDVIGKTFFETSDGKLYAKGQIGNMYEVVGNKFVDTGFREISQVYEGDDILDPGKGKDSTRGGGGNDTHISEYGENTAHGGAGQDMHLVKLGSDPDVKTTIKDFNPAEGDRILVTGFPQDQLAEGWINGKNIGAFLKAANITVKSSGEMVAEIVKRDGELQVEIKGPLVSEKGENTLKGTVYPDNFEVKLGDPKLKTAIEEFNAAHGDRITISNLPKEKVPEGEIKPEDIGALLKQSGIKADVPEGVSAQAVERDGSMQVVISGAAK